MTYSIEKIREQRLEDTAIPNIFIEDILPDADGDYVRVYLYAYMRCKQNTALTHSQLAEELGLPIEKVLSAWQYFAEKRKIVRKVANAKGDDTFYDIEFIDLKGEMYAPKKSGKLTLTRRSTDTVIFDDDLRRLFDRVAVIVGTPTLDGRDAEKILSWIRDDGAMPEIVEAAYTYSRAQNGITAASYVAKIVKKWAEKGLRTKEDVAEHLAEHNARYGVYKSLMEAVGLRYSVPNEGEKERFDLWLDDYGYTPERLLDLAKLTAGAKNKLQYLSGIVEKDRKTMGSDDSIKAGTNTGPEARSEYYRQLRAKQEADASAKLARIHADIPKIKEIDNSIEILNMELFKTLTSGKDGKDKTIKSINAQISGKQDERAQFLEKAGYPADYTDHKYACERCNDTGILENGSSCDCFVKLR